MLGPGRDCCPYIRREGRKEVGRWEQVGGQGRRSRSQGNRWIVTGEIRKWKGRLVYNSPPLGPLATKYLFRPARKILLPILQEGGGRKEVGMWEQLGGHGRRSRGQGNRWLVTGESRKRKRGRYCSPLGCQILNSSLDQENNPLPTTHSGFA